MTIGSPSGRRGTLTHDRKVRAASERGAVLVEFSLVVVLFVALLYGLIAYGMAFALKESATNAASEAARSAVGLTGAAAQEQAYQTAEDRLGWLKDRCCDRTTDGTASDAPMKLTVDPPTSCSTGGDCITVETEYAYEENPLVPILRLPGFTYLFPEKITSKATVQVGP